MIRGSSGATRRTVSMPLILVPSDYVRWLQPDELVDLVN